MRDGKVVVEAAEVVAPEVRPVSVTSA
jgi:hypothetical protein